jgi:hypothetical protein
MTTLRSRRVLAVGLVACLGFAPAAEARVTRIVLAPPTQPFGTTSFGAAGTYEQLDGVAFGELDPRDPFNAVIQDIALAPRNARGMVEYSTSLSILKPVDEAKGDHTLLFEIANRGRKLDPFFYNVGATPTDQAGDGFLERQGLTLVWAGWEADLAPVPGLVTMQPVIPHRPDGKAITGVVRSEFIVTAAATTQNILADSSLNTPGYPTVSLDNGHDVLTRRVHQHDPRIRVPNSDWAYADCTNIPFPGKPDPQKLCLKQGFDTDHIYELTYTAKDPIVMGLGLAAIRDVGSFLRHAEHDDAGTANPLGTAIQTALLNGISQSGRLLRVYLDLGFNEDEQHHQVYDGMQPHIGSVRDYMNVRFAQPGRLAGTQHTETEYPGSEAPLTYEPSTDPETGRRRGLLDRCTATRTCPKIVHTMSDIEYWQASGAADTTDPLGTHDETLPATVRIYQFSSTQHAGYSPVAALPTATGPCQQLPNANSYTYNLRALLVALQAWVAKGTEPPASDYSTLKNGSLVPLDRLNFPVLPGVTDPQGIFNVRTAYFRGPHYRSDSVSGIISTEPPAAFKPYPSLVPKVDGDGNDVDGVRSVTLRAPLGTYTGWNVRKAGFSAGDSCDLIGGWVPFAPTKSARTQHGDTRPSLQERYGTLAAYTAAAKTAADQLVAKGELLASDVADAVTNATKQAHAAGLD